MVKRFVNGKIEDKEETFPNVLLRRVQIASAHGAVYCCSGPISGGSRWWKLFDKSRNLFTIGAADADVGNLPISTG